MAAARLGQEHACLIKRGERHMSLCGTGGMRSTAGHRHFSPARHVEAVLLLDELARSLR